MVPVLLVITGITFAFTFLVCCVSIVRSLYFNIFLASFFITFHLLEVVVVAIAVV